MERTESIPRIPYSEEEKKQFRTTVFKDVPDDQFQEGWRMVETWGIDLRVPGEFYITRKHDKKTGIFLYQFTVDHQFLLKLAHELGMSGLRHSLEFADSDTRKDHPISDTVTIKRFDGAEFSEPTYFRDRYVAGSMWDTKPHEMLRLCAEAACIRVAFNLYGLYTKEETEEEPEKNFIYNAYDLADEFITEAEMKNMISDIETNFFGQTVTGEELDCCRRSDGNYDRKAATLLKRQKYTAWTEQKGQA